MNDFTFLIILSALSLGVYDLFRKHAVRGNAVHETLFFSCLAGAVFFVIASGISGRLGGALDVTPRVLALLFAKSALVGASWMCVYAAMREIPVSTAAPIRSTAPLWTALGGILLYGELPGAWRALGMAVILAGYFMLAAIGNGEGFSFKHKAMRLLIAGTLLGSASALYDKHLLNSLRIPPETTQFWFMTFLAMIYGALTIAKRLRASARVAGHAFIWRWSIPATGILLTIADALYFHAMSLPDAPISVASVMRRTGCVVTVIGGAVLFKEKGFVKKIAAVATILAGAAITALAGK